LFGFFLFVHLPLNLPDLRHHAPFMLIIQLGLEPSVPLPLQLFNVDLDVVLRYDFFEFFLGLNIALKHLFNHLVLELTQSLVFFLLFDDFVGERVKRPQFIVVLCSFLLHVRLNQVQTAVQVLSIQPV